MKELLELSFSYTTDPEEAFTDVDIVMAQLRVEICLTGTR